MADPEAAASADGPAAADLPAPLRRRTAAMAADALGRLTEEELPVAWRRLARFAPGPRARHANPSLLVALEDDPPFRQRIATQVRERYAWTDRVDAGERPADADPQDVAAAAWLLRPEGWGDLVGSAVTVEPVSTPPDDSEVVARLRDQLASVRAEGRRASAELRAEADRLKKELADVRRQLREETRRREQAERAVSDQQTRARRQRGADERRLSDAEASARRLQSRLRDAESALEGVRRSAREGRSSADVRTRLLLDTLVDASQALRRELALPPVTARPADDVVAAGGAEALSAPDVQARDNRALADDDPAVLEAVLALPQVHLVIDGYNVTKEGYGGLTLEDQRSRLVGSLAALVARLQIEVTAVFDGAAVDVRVGLPTRGVRVVFSPPGESADEVIRRLVRAEPPGRAVVVVSSDREVADGVVDAGARAFPSRTLLGVLGRT